MKQRILVAVVGVPALLAVLCAAPDWATLALLMGLCIIASHELLTAVLPPEKTRRWWGLAATLAVFVVANVYFSHERFAGTAAAGLMPWLVAALVVLLFLCMVLEYGKKEEMDFTALCAILVAGAAIPLALSCLLRLRMLEHGAMADRSPKNFSRMLSRSMVSTASSRYCFKRPMMALTSSAGRFQFSVEKAYTVRYSTPSSLQ